MTKPGDDGGEGQRKEAIDGVLGSTVRTARADVGGA